MSPSDLLGLLLVTLATMLAMCALPSNAQTQQYGVILDAGSSGSRMHVYNWTRRFSASSLPRFNRTNYVQPNSALSNYANNMSDIRANVVEPLLAWAKDKIPSSAWGSTSIYVLATAGKLGGRVGVGVLLS
jgi:Golgi nucleoside diphosphatase